MKEITVEIIILKKIKQLKKKFFLRVFILLRHLADPKLPCVQN